MSRLGELSKHIKAQLHDPDWATRREIIRAIVQRIEVGPAKVTIVLRLPVDPAVRGMEPIMRTLLRA